MERDLRGWELGERRRERRKIESERGSEGGSKKEKSSVRENRTSGAKRVGFARYARLRGQEQRFLTRFIQALGWYMVRWHEPNHIVLYHVCVRTTLAANLSRGTYNIPNARNIHVAQTRCPLEGTAHATRSPCRIEKPSPRRRVPKRPFYPNAVQNTMPCYILCYACSEDVKSGLA